MKNRIVLWCKLYPAPNDNIVASVRHTKPKEVDTKYGFKYKKFIEVIKYQKGMKKNFQDENEKLKKLLRRAYRRNSDLRSRLGASVGGYIHSVVRK